MNFTAIICELNPLTIGHKKIIEEAKKLTNNPIICIMSGNFVQRGEPAILDKYTRANLATNAGADIVIELPTIFALSSAPDFAFGAIKFLNCIKNIEYLCFGSECGDINTLYKLLDKTNSSSNNTAKTILDSGISVATAQCAVLGDYAKPNNILGIEYLKAIKQTNSHIRPLTIKREDNYKDNIINYTASATALRKLIKEENFNELSKLAPQLNGINPLEYSNMSTFYKLLEFSIKTSNTFDLEKINGVSEGIENRIYNAYNQTLDPIKTIITKRYPEGKVKRILCCSLLKITKELINNAKETDCTYLKVLAVKNKKFLSFLPNEKLVIKKEDYNKLNANQLNVINVDLLASKIYSCINTSYPPASDFTNKL